MFDQEIIGSIVDVFNDVPNLGQNFVTRARKSFH